MYEEISNWIDSVWTTDIPENVVALNFNLYDDGDNNWSIELIGAGSYDPDNFDWACDEVFDFETRDNPYEWVKEVEWNEIQQEMVDVLNKYLEEGKNASSMKEFKAIGVGFIDGDISILHENC